MVPIGYTLSLRGSIIFFDYPGDGHVSSAVLQPAPVHNHHRIGELDRSSLESAAPIQPGGVWPVPVQPKSNPQLPHQPDQLQQLDQVPSCYQPVPPQPCPPLLCLLHHPCLLFLSFQLIQNKFHLVSGYKLYYTQCAVLLWNKMAFSV